MPDLPQRHRILQVRAVASHTVAHNSTHIYTCVYIYIHCIVTIPGVSEGKSNRDYKLNYLFIGKV